MGKQAKTKDEAVFDSLMIDVEEGRYPEEALVKTPSRFENNAGSILNLPHTTFGSASFIESVSGAVRSNHYHQTDWHFIFVVEGLMLYYDRKVGGKGPCRRTRVPAGSMVFTPPLVEHATYFPVATKVLTLNRWRRDHDHHEADVIRIPMLVTNEVCPAVLMGVKCCLPYESNRDEGGLTIHAKYEGYNLHESIDGRHFTFDGRMVL